MPSIILDRYEAKSADWHPGLCARCDQPAECTLRRSLAWTPGWVYIILIVGLIPFVIVYIVLTQKATVVLPFCNRHRNHWQLGNYVLYGGLTFGAVLLILVVVAGLAATNARKEAIDLVMALGLIGCGGMFLLWVIVLGIVQLFTIRAGRITESSVTVLGLSDAFCDAAERADLEAEQQELRYAQPLAPAQRPSSAAGEPRASTKLCPFCSEEIKATAVKCRFCGEFLA